MSAFNGDTRLRRAAADPATDQKLPAPVLLSWKAIAEPRGLSGTNGQECEVVHGDRARRITGNRTDSIEGDSWHTVDGDQTLTIHGKHKETIVQNCYQNFVGPHIVLNQTVRNETHMGARTVIYGDFLNRDTSSGTLFYADLLMEHTNVLNFEWSDYKLEAQGLHVEVKGAHIGASGIEASACKYQASDTVYRLLDEKVVTKIDGLVSDISFVSNQLGALQHRMGVVLTPCDPNGTVLC
jgi:hypothetical protein